MADTSKKTILLIATLDTKAAEARFLKESVESQGCAVMVMNPGILAAPPYKPDVDNVELAAAAGEEPQGRTPGLKDKGRCIAAMMASCAIPHPQALRRRKIQGVVSIGGDQEYQHQHHGHARRPFGVPKFMVSTVAGRASSAVHQDCKDIIIAHSVADIAGLNRVTRSVMWKAAVSIAAMVKSDEASVVNLRGEIPVAMSMLGTAAGRHARHRPGIRRLRSRRLPSEQYRRHSHGRHDPGRRFQGRARSQYPRNRRQGGPGPPRRHSRLPPGIGGA